MNCNVTSEEHEDFLSGKNSAFYTPSFEAELMIELLKIENNNEYKILEPSIGTGNLIIPILEVIHSNGVDVKDFIENKLYGLDIDEKAVNIAKCRVLKWFEGKNLDKPLTFNFIVADTLKYRFDFKFDYVIANPPYLRGGKFTSLKKYLKDNYVSYHGNGDLYFYFLEFGFKHLKKDGELVYLIPSSWTRSQSGERLREFLSKKELLEVIDFDYPVFKNATVDVFAFHFKNKIQKEILELRS